VTEHITAQQLRARTPGSMRLHDGLQEAVRVRLALHGLEAFSVYTGGVPRFLRGGEMVLRRNPHQVGVPDLFVPYLDLHACGLPYGRIAFLEVKSGAARRKPPQVRFQKLLESLGLPCLLVRRQEDVDPIIKAHRDARRIAWPHPRSR